MSTTEENLKAAFAGESQANRRYLFFAEQAEKDGYAQVARLLRAVAEAETVHARNHLGIMGGIGSTGENVESAIKGEHYEFMKMYPEFIEQAKKEGNQGAVAVFDYAAKVEKVHHRLFQEAERMLESKKEFAYQPYYVCSICGYTAEREAPDKCPVCQATRDKFKKIE